MADPVSADIYALHLVVGPPKTIQPNAVMHVPVVVAVRDASMKEDGTGPHCTGDMSGVWAFVSLVAGDDTEVLAPPRTDLLLGRTAASVVAPSPQAEPNRRIVGYVHFPDLVISAPGQYRLRVSLVDMDTNGPSYRVGGEGGLNLQTVTSSIITVDPATETMTPTAEETVLVERLRTHGVIS